MATETKDQIIVHAQNYHRFMLFVKWSAIHFAAILAFLIVGFATDAGAAWGLIVGVAVFAVGAYAMTHGLAHSSEGDGPGGLPAS